MAEQKSIRQMCDEKIALFRDIDTLSPQQIAQELVEISSLWSSVNKELVDRRCWYAERKKMFLIDYGKAAVAIIHAEASPEYRSMLEAEAYGKSLQELIRTGKHYVRLATEEQRESKY